MENKIKEFYNHLMSHDDLLQKIKKQKINIQSQEDLKNFIDSTLIPIANEENFNLSAKELFEYENKNLQMLSELQLSDVSGGVGMKSIAISGISSIMLICNSLIPSVSTFVRADSDPPPSSSNSSVPNTSTFRKIVGLPNIGNSCYLNSAIQQLYSCKDLRDAIKSVSLLLEIDGEEIPPDMTNLYNFSKLFRAMSDSSISTISDDTMKQCIQHILDSQGDSVDDGFTSILGQFESSEAKRSICNKIKLIPSYNDDQRMFSDMNDILSHVLDGVAIRDDKNQLTEVNVNKLIRFICEKDVEDSEGTTELSDHLILCFPFSKENNVKIDVHDFSDVFEAPKNTIQYCLESFSVNTGVHYITFTKNTDDKWVCINDDKTSDIPIDFREALENARCAGVITSLTYSKKIVG